MRVCPAPSCKVFLVAKEPACKPHWRELPSKLRDTIIEAAEARARFTPKDPQYEQLTMVLRSAMYQAMLIWEGRPLPRT